MANLNSCDRSCCVLPDTDSESPLKSALLHAVTEISPNLQSHLFLHTDDQFESLEPPLNVDDYLCSLEDTEGITDLFDIGPTCNFNNL